MCGAHTLQLDILDKILHPISLQWPCGEPHNYNDKNIKKGIYSLRDLRRTAKNNERIRAQQGSSQLICKDDWKPVYQLSLKICHEESKDLEVIACLLEALLRLEEFSGLTKGLKILENILEIFHHDYKNLYTQDPDDILFPIESITGAQGSEGGLNTTITYLELTQQGELAPYALWQYQQALEFKKISNEEVRQQKIAKGVVTLEQIERAGSHTSPEFAQKTLTEIQKAISQCDKVQNLINLLFPENNLSFLSVKNSLIQCSHMLSFLYESKLTQHIDEANEKSNQNPPEYSVQNKIKAQSQIHLEPKSNDLITQIEMSLKNIPKSKSDLLLAIEKISKIYQELEPHSPVPYLLNQSLKWGRMPLIEIFDEFTNPDNKTFITNMLKGNENNE